MFVLAHFVRCRFIGAIRLYFFFFFFCTGIRLENYYELGVGIGRADSVSTEQIDYFRFYSVIH